MQAVQFICSSVDSLNRATENFVEATKAKAINIIPLQAREKTDQAMKQAHQVMEIVKPIAKGLFKYYSLYTMYEAAFSDILCLQTYRHGTDPYAAVRISLFGPNLNKAGKGGEAKYYQALGLQSAWAERDQERKAFYVVKQSCGGADPLAVMFNYMDNKLTAKYYSLRSTTTFFASFLPLPMTWKAKIITEIVDALESHRQIKFLSFFTPTVKFHIDSRLTRMDFIQDDKGAGAGTVYTQDQFSAFDSGMSGILKNGLNSRLFTRISENKSQFLWGVAQLVTAVAFTAFCFPHLIPGGNLVVAEAMKVDRFLKTWGDLGAMVAFPVAIPLFYAALQW